jgi:hypothetical protein
MPGMKKGSLRLRLFAAGTASILLALSTLPPACCCCSSAMSSAAW